MSQKGESYLTRYLYWKIYIWVILRVVFLASIAGPLTQAKVPPLMSVIMDSFQLSLGEAGWLMSVFALTGVFLSLPAGILSERFGPKRPGGGSLWVV